MVILDTNHMDALMIEHPRRDVLLGRIDRYEFEVTTTIVSMQENVEGWLKKINDSLRVAPLEQVRYYRLFEGIFRFYSDWEPLPFDENAALRYDDLKRLRLIGPKVNDLKIAAI